MLKKKTFEDCCVLCKTAETRQCRFLQNSIFSFFKNLCKIKNLLFEKFYDKYFFFFQKISEENNFCENVEKKTFEDCCVLCKTAETR